MKDFGRKCQKRGCNETSVQEHHIIPKGVKESNGDVIILCKKHHNLIHNYYLNVVWDYIQDKEGAKFAIREFVKYFLSKEEK